MTKIFELTEEHKYKVEGFTIIDEDYVGEIDEYEVGSLTLQNTVTSESDTFIIWRAGEDEFYVCLPTGGPEDDEEDDLDVYPIDTFDIHLYGIGEGEEFKVGIL